MNMSGIIKGGLVAGLLINVSEFVLNTMVVPVAEGKADPSRSGSCTPSSSDC